MSIYCQIPPYADSDVFTHRETIWEVAKVNNFEDPENIIDTTITSGKDLNSFISALTVPKGETYYVRASRVFLEERSNETLVPIEVQNYDEIYNNNIIHSESVHVEKPFIYVNMEEFNDNNFIDFEVRTSAFRCQQDGHYCTHWFVTDINGNVLFKYLNATSKEDKLFIRLNKTTDLLNKSVFFIHAIHVSSNGIESPKATYSFSCNNFAFDVLGLTTDLTPGINATFEIFPASARDAYVSSVFLKVPGENGSITKGVDVTPAPGNNTITLPGYELNYNSEYYLDFYCYNNKNEYTTRRIFLKTRKSNFAALYNPNFRYEKQLAVYPKSLLARFNTALNYTTFELPDKRVFVPRLNSDRLVTYKAVYSSTSTGSKIELDLGTNSNGYGLVDNVQLPSTVSNDILIKMLNGNLILIDATAMGSDGTNRPKFQLYNYNRLTGDLTLQHESNVRENEQYPLGRSNSIFQYTTSECYYLDNGEGKIMKYDFVNNNVSEALVPEPIVRTGIKAGCMFYNRKSGKAIIIGTNGRMYTFDPEAIEIRESGDVPFEDWVGGSFKPVELPNGDYLLINVGTFDTRTMPNSIVYYDALNNKYTNVTYEDANSNVKNVGTISGFSTSLFLHNRESTKTAENNLLARLF